MSVRATIRRDHGFSLVEALAALVVVGMIAMMLTQGLDVGRRVWAHAGSTAAGGESVGAAQGVLRDRLEQVFPATLFDSTQPYVDFDGSQTQVTFLASPPQAGRPAPLRRYRLSLTPGGDLILGSLSDVAAPHAAVDTQTLLEGVQGLELAYFGPAAPDMTRRWRPEWEQQAAPPERVRVRLTLGPDDRRAWPDLVVRPLATMDSDCSFDQTTHHCKGR